MRKYLMVRFYHSSVIVSYLVVLSTPVPCTGVNVRIGALTPAFHDVTGVLYVVNKYEFCIANFTYDGLGPGMFSYHQVS